MEEVVHKSVKEYYGEILKSSDDLKTSACCDSSALPDWLKPLLARIHPEVLSRYYGCGLVAPELLTGCTVLDLGCGAGRDVYALSQLTGSSGKVVGVDMTKEQLDVANKYKQYHTEQFGYDNVEFLMGYIENLGELGLGNETFDVIVSNCVINLSPDKEAVLKGVYSLLKEGGELYFSDVYADRRIPQHVRDDKVLYGECLGGALYWNDFLSLAVKAVFSDPRLVTSRELEITDEKLKEKTGNIKFYSATYRLFKLKKLECSCEDYGQALVYKGTIPGHSHSFSLDNHHKIDTGRIFPVCGNTFLMLKESRFASHFDFLGNFEHHYGVFPGCGYEVPFESGAGSNTGSCC
ncbi:Methyltransferase type 11 [Chitinispirillum alkaliphilum]|nr:Methyltransferase type 11 [Chitinispirillum alkaliphilum]